jgi:DNA-binding transcriptional ArsR family regulator
MDVARIARMFRALAHPQRLSVFERVRAAGVDCSEGGRGQLSVCEVAEGIRLSLSTVSHHLKELKEAGLIRCERRGQRVFCVVDPQALDEIEAFTRSSLPGGKKADVHH